MLAAFDCSVSRDQLENLLSSRDNRFYQKTAGKEKPAQVGETAGVAAKVQERHEDPFGRRTLVSGTDLADFGFDGMYYHQASGLSFTLNRAYDPNLGRWTTRDPAGENGGINLYDFVGGDPINYFDPMGLAPSQVMGNGMTWDSEATLAQDYTEGLASLSPRAREGVTGGITSTGSVSTMLVGASISDGPGALVGVPTMIIGAISFGLGTSQVAHSISNGGPVSPQGNVPGGPFELVGSMTGNPNYQAFGGMADSLIPFPTDVWSGLGNGTSILLNPPEFSPDYAPFAPTNNLPSPLDPRKVHRCNN